MPSHVRLLAPLCLLVPLMGCVPAEYRSADDRSAQSGKAPMILPLRDLLAAGATTGTDPDATAAELGVRNAALALRRDSLASTAPAAQDGLRDRAATLQDRADTLRARD